MPASFFVDAEYFELISAIFSLQYRSGKKSSSTPFDCLFLYAIRVIILAGTGKLVGLSIPKNQEKGRKWLDI